MGSPRNHEVIKVSSTPTDHDELVCEFRASISAYQVQPKTGALNLGLLIAYEHLKDEVLDLGRHTGMDLVVQVYRPAPQPSVLDMARIDEQPLGEDDDKVVRFLKGIGADG